MTNQSTNNNNMSDSAVEQRVAYNDYCLECAAEGTKPKPFHQWANAGKMFTPAQLSQMTGGAKPATVAVASNEVPKSEKARIVFARHAATGTLVRKNIINEFQTEAGLTAAGSATYYANITAQYKKDPAAFMAKYHVVAPVVEEATTEDLVDETGQEEVGEEIQAEVDTDASFDTSDFDDNEVEDNQVEIEA